MSKPVITFDNVSKIYRKSKVPALDNFNLVVNRGEFVFLIGPSGSGKSTMLSLILREEKATSGSIVVNKQELSKLSSWKVAQYRRSLGCVFQDFQLLPNKTVLGNVAFALEVTGGTPNQIKARSLEVLDQVGLSGKSKRLISELSGGEAQRVAVARALANEPKIILADEPTGNLDPETAKEIMQLFESINSNGTTILMATHAADIVNRSDHRVVALRKGVLVNDDPTGKYVDPTFFKGGK